MKFRSVVFIILFFSAFSCGTKRQLQTQFKGKPVTVLTEQFGEPKTILKKENETVYVFEKIKELESTEINQGRLTLDEIVTPKVSKTERYYFTVRDSIIVETRYEEEYER